MLPELSSFAAYLPLELFWVSIRHSSSCRGVGFTVLLKSHTCVCSPRYLRLPPTCHSNYFGYPFAILQRAGCWLHCATQVTYLCMFPELSSFTAYLPLELFWVSIRHSSSCRGVGFTVLLRSHTCVCSPSYLRLPPTCHSNYFGYPFAILQRAGCWLHCATQVTYLCMLPELSSFAAYLPLELFWVSIRHSSTCRGVGITVLFQITNLHNLNIAG